MLACTIVNPWIREKYNIRKLYAYIGMFFCIILIGLVNNIGDTVSDEERSTTFHNQVETTIDDYIGTWECGDYYIWLDISSDSLTLYNNEGVIDTLSYSVSDNGELVVDEEYNLRISFQDSVEKLVMYDGETKYTLFASSLPESFEVKAPTETEDSQDNILTPDSKNMKVGDIAQFEDFYIGLNSVHSMNRVQTAIDGYYEDIDPSHVIIYSIFEIYNVSEKVKQFYSSDLTAYADGVQVAGANSNFLSACNNVKQLQSYKIDSNKMAVFLSDFEVSKEWKEIKFYVDSSCIWTITPDSLVEGDYDYSKSMISREYDKKITEDEKITDFGDYEFVYKGFSYNDDGAFFFFRINNNGAEQVNTRDFRYNARCYQNDHLLKDASYTLDDNINGYINIYDVDSVKAGMSANVYFAFEIDNSYESILECVYDQESGASVVAELK